MFEDIKIINKELISINVSKKCSKSDCCLKQQPERLLKELKQLSIENKIDKVLVNACATCTTIPDTFAQFKLGSKFSKIINSSGIVVGIYGNCNCFSSFTETVAVNRGSILKVSSNKDEIAEWFELDTPLS